MFVFSMTWLLPLLVMIGSYMTIIVIIIKRARMMRIQRENESEGTCQSVVGRAKIRTIRITGVLVVGFVLCWTPYNAMFVW